MRKQKFNVGDEFTTTSGEVLKITGTQQRTTSKEGIDVVCGMYYICEIDTKEVKLTSDKLSQRIGEAPAKSSKDFTPGNAEAIERGFENFASEYNTICAKYLTQVSALTTRYHMNTYTSHLTRCIDGNAALPLRNYFVNTWSDIVANNNARKREAKEAKAKEAKANKALEVLKALSPEMRAALLAQLQCIEYE
jgi:hypothetical protein